MRHAAFTLPLFILAYIPHKYVIFCKFDKDDSPHAFEKNQKAHHRDTEVTQSKGRFLEDAK
ncbi:hypothetical protein UNDYM_4353 [Undibacterium sp. YM2]|nr:hypothetical protein UNDYM_4353 [Undibacterium sp. YM2]